MHLNKIIPAINQDNVSKSMLGMWSDWRPMWWQGVSCAYHILVLTLVGSDMQVYNHTTIAFKLFLWFYYFHSKKKDHRLVHWCLGATSLSSVPRQTWETTWGRIHPKIILFVLAPSEHNTELWAKGRVKTFFFFNGILVNLFEVSLCHFLHHTQWKLGVNGSAVQVTLCKSSPMSPISVVRVLDLTYFIDFSVSNVLWAGLKCLRLPKCLLGQSEFRQCCVR